MDRLKGKVAVVTGASSGYGRSIARLFAKEGAKVACFDISEKVGVGFEEDDDHKLSTSEDIKANGGDAIYVYCDISDKECVAKAFEKVDECYGKVDILVNNAGIYRSGVPIDEMTGEWLNKILNVNLYGSYYCAQQALKRMKKAGNGGRVIQVCSTAAYLATAFEACYDISKGACLMLSRSIAAEYGEFGISCNAICPAAGKTPMNRNPYSNTVFRTALEKSTALGMWVEPYTVASYAVYFASDESNGVTGTEAIVDSGARACGGGHAKNMRNLFNACELEQYYTQEL